MRDRGDNLLWEVVVGRLGWPRSQMKMIRFAPRLPEIPP